MTMLLRNPVPHGTNSFNTCILDFNHQNLLIAPKV